MFKTRKPQKWNKRLFMKMILESSTTDPMVIMVLIPKNPEIREILSNALENI